MSLVEINFDEKVCALILLVSLPNSWEPTRAAVSNSTGNSKLKFNDVKDKILAEEVHKKDLGEATTSNCALNIGTRGKSYDRNFYQAIVDRIQRMEEENPNLGEMWNVGIVASLVT